MYYITTGVAPFFSRRLFEAVTGRKTDWWLVQTVGALVTVVGGALVHAATEERIAPRDRAIALGAAAGLGAIETANAFRRRISRVYLLDAALQAGFIAAWIVARRRRAASTERFLVSGT
jgi:hypothetical protein